VRGLVQPSFIPRRRPKSWRGHDASKHLCAPWRAAAGCGVASSPRFILPLRSVVVGMRNATDIVDNVGPLHYAIPAQFLAGIEAEAIDRRRGSYRALNVTRSGFPVALSMLRRYLTAVDARGIAGTDCGQRRVDPARPVRAGDGRVCCLPGRAARLLTPEEMRIEAHARIERGTPLCDGRYLRAGGS